MPHYTPTPCPIWFWGGGDRQVAWRVTLVSVCEYPYACAQMGGQAPARSERGPLPEPLSRMEAPVSGPGRRGSQHIRSTQGDDGWRGRSRDCSRPAVLGDEPAVPAQRLIPGSFKTLSPLPPPRTAPKTGQGRASPPCCPEPSPTPGEVRRLRRQPGCWQTPGQVPRLLRTLQVKSRADAFLFPCQVAGACLGTFGTGERSRSLPCSF